MRMSRELACEGVILKLKATIVFVTGILLFRFVLIMLLMLRCEVQEEVIV